MNKNIVGAVVIMVVTLLPLAIGVVVCVLSCLDGKGHWKPDISRKIALMFAGIWFYLFVWGASLAFVFGW